MGESPVGVPGAQVRALAPTAGSGERTIHVGQAWFWLPWPCLVALDLWSKYVAFDFLAREHPTTPEKHRLHEVFSGPVHFELVAWGNTGTIWGLLQDATLPLMVMRCVAVVGLFWFLTRTERGARLQQLVLSLILAGALGNLYDNFTRADRSVRDFLHFSGTWPGAWDFPAFNVADSCITVGAITLFVLLWREDRRTARPQVE
jgi:lipoprotein signal peptidase